MKRHLQRWGAIYIILALFLGSWIGQLVSESIEFTREQEQDGHIFLWMEFWPKFLASTFENWQSEFLQLAFQGVVLLGAKHILFKADAEDTERLEGKVEELQTRIKSHDESRKEDIARIERKLNWIAARMGIYKDGEE